MHRSVKPSPSQKGKQWITDPAVRQRHRAWIYLSATNRKATPLHKIVTVAQLVKKRCELAEIVTVIRITHDDVLARGSSYTSHQRAAITFFRDRHHTCARRLRQVLRAIAATIVCDDHFTVDTILREEPLSFPDAALQGLSFVQTRNDNREFQHSTHDRITGVIFVRALSFLLSPATCHAAHRRRFHSSEF